VTITIALMALAASIAASEIMTLLLDTTASNDDMPRHTHKQTDTHTHPMKTRAGTD